MGKRKIPKRQGKRSASSTGKESKKHAAAYTTEQFLDKAEEYIDTFQYDLAEKFCERALEQEASSLRALEMSGILHLEFGRLDEAKSVFNKAIELSPENGHEKYMYMGQIHTSSEAVTYFMKGIDLMKKYMVDMAAQAENMASAEQRGISPLDVSSAYCSVAEIYLTDECFGEDAEGQCKQVLDEALSACAENPDAHHLYASYWLSKQEQQKALEEMQKGLALWLPQWKQASEEEKNEADADVTADDSVSLCSLSYPARINATKLLVELEQYETASDILELLLDEEDEVVETWYLLGWVNYLQGEDYKNNARYYLGKAQKIAKKTKCEDIQLKAHVNELLQELGGPVDEEEENNDDMEILSDSEEEESNQTNGHETMDQ